MNSNQLELMDRSPEQQAIEQSNDAASEARRTEYLERLRAALPELRKLEGFPIGSDEDILALSDPPYYTACPNPFLAEFISEHGTPYDEATDDYHREPFAADVSEGKNDPIYNAHSYHTKVPHKAIMRYILHYTKPGDIVFDGFCGTGMTGVAAQLCGSPDPDFRATVEAEWTGAGHPKPEWGARYAVLGDLSPAATFIAYNYNTPADVGQLEREASQILDDVEAELGWMYETAHADGSPRRVEYVVWAEVRVCPHCGSDVLLGADGERTCQECGTRVSRRGGTPRLETTTDAQSGRLVRRPKRIPFLIGYRVGSRILTKTPDEGDLDLIRRIGGIRLVTIPNEPMLFREGQWGDLQRLYHAGMTKASDFYVPRTLVTLAQVAARFAKSRHRLSLLFLFTSQLTNLSLMNRYRPDVSFPYNPMSGTLYVGSLAKESSPFTAYRNKLKRIIAAKELVSEGHSAIFTDSITGSHLPPGSVDYVFVDPPFGDNLPYSELNFLAESWLRVWTRQEPEAIISGVQRKGLPEYTRLMQLGFRSIFDVLKAGRWMTVEFHNSSNAVWNAIQEAIQRAGFVVADVRTLDKETTTKKQATGANAVKQDLVISAYKPRVGFEQRFDLEAGTEAGAWDFIREHLTQLPLFVEHNGRVELVAERQNYLLFDRMVAFHIQRGATVPLSAAQFYAGLGQRFLERDDMYFTQLQAAEYDRRRLDRPEIEQISVFVVDEKSARQWIRAELLAKPQTFQELHPKFLRELNQNRYEELPELRDMLQQSFLEDDATHRWRMPDPGKEADLEALRYRALLNEFGTYLPGNAKLKRFRIEAVRAGFADLWAKRAYGAIIAMAERLPDEVVQEDPALLMYYDNAVTREGAG